MKNILIFISVILVSEAVHAQKELCPYDTMLDYDIRTLYALLNTLDTATLTPFFDRLVEQDGLINAALKKAAVEKLKSQADTIKRMFLIYKQNLRPCLPCSVNKELTDYRIALVLLAQHLDKLPGEVNSGFRYNDAMAAYHHLVSVRSALMAMVDATSRYHQVQQSIRLSEKRVKRHVTLWGAVTLGVIGIVYIIQENSDWKE